MAERTIDREYLHIDFLRRTEGSDLYRDFLSNAQGVNLLPRVAQTLRNSSSPEAAGNAKKSLVNIINGELGHQTVSMDDSDSKLFEYVPELKPLFDQKSIAAMKLHGEDLIREARRVQDQRARRKVKDFGGIDHDYHKFARRFLEVTPYQTGDGRYDAVVHDHQIFKGIVEASREGNLGGDKTNDRVAFADATAKYVAADVEVNLALTDLRELYDLEDERERSEVGDLQKNIQRLTQIAAENYINSSPERQKIIANQIAGNAAKRVESKLPEDQRTDYTERMLREGLRIADEAFRDDKAKGRAAYLQVAEDTHTVVS